MIIIRIDSGLGNQMFQYAMYNALQQRYPGVRVVADIRKYNLARIHNGLELEEIFPIHLEVMYGTKNNHITLADKCWHFTVDKLILTTFKIGLNKLKFIKDTGTFNEEILHFASAHDYYLEGRWGNEKYFQEIKPVIRENFRFKIALDPCNEKLSKQLIAENSIGVHIRRGDYLTSKSGFVNLSEGDYYQDACSYLKYSTQNPVFYIFSDDSNWCKRKLTWLKDYSHFFVENNKDGDNYKDMQLMSLCKHNVIANSTFSWWGAWLNNNPLKKIICPKNLFYNETKNSKILSEFYPDTWIKM